MVAAEALALGGGGRQGHRVEGGRAGVVSGRLVAGAVVGGTRVDARQPGSVLGAQTKITKWGEMTFWVYF